jgi:predicted DNA-binding protein YlxM (UPF0122 family)
MNKIETLKRKIIKKAKLDTIDKTIDVIEKYISKMNLAQLKTTREYVKAKQMKDGVNEGNATFLKIVDEKIEEILHGKQN